MSFTPKQYRQAQRRVVEAEGYATLGMHWHVLQALSEFPPQFQSIVVHMLRGDAYREMALYVHALKEFEQAGRLEPANVHVLLAQAWCYKRIDLLSEAIALTRQALAVDPNYEIVHYNLACYYCLADNPLECIRHLTRALQLKPELWHSVPKEADFDALRQDPRFLRMVEQFRQRMQARHRKRLAAAQRQQDQSAADQPHAKPKAKGKSRSKSPRKSPASPPSQPAPESQPQPNLTPESASGTPPQSAPDAPPASQPKTRSKAKPKAKVQPKPESSTSSGASAPVEAPATPATELPLPPGAKSVAKSRAKSGGRSQSQRPKRGRSKGESPGEASGEAAAAGPE
ncbi:MAG: TPR end-of-group domain-containing protein [Planctomycetaceae bacterium]